MMNTYGENMKILYWAGCVTSHLVPKIGISMMKILDKAGIRYKHLGSKEICCGYPLILLGDIESFKVQANKVIDLIVSENIDTVVTSCPGCYRAFSKFYPEYVGGLPFKVVHSTQLIYNLVKKGLIKPSKPLNLTCTYHDPCDLGRHLGIYDIPRELILMIPGIKYIEMDRSRDAARCCGGGGGLRLLIPQLSTQIAITRIKDDVIPINVDAVVTACPTCVKNLRDGSSIASVIYGLKEIRVYDIVELVSESIE